MNLGVATRLFHSVSESVVYNLLFLFLFFFSFRTKFLVFFLFFVSASTNLTYLVDFFS